MPFNDNALFFDASLIDDSFYQRFLSIQKDHHGKYHVDARDRKGQGNLSRIDLGKENGKWMKLIIGEQDQRLP